MVGSDGELPRGKPTLQAVGGKRAGVEARRTRDAGLKKESLKVRIKLPKSGESAKVRKNIY
jgi:hypothetical protein